MSRSKRDILDTEKMLERLKETLRIYGPSDVLNSTAHKICRSDAEALRRISMTLHNWYELECNEDIQRGRMETLNSGREGAKRHFIPDAKGTLFICSHGQTGENRYYSIPDREAGATKRLKVIMARYPKLGYYIQGDPRGCALYILRPGDIPKGESADAYYNRGLAVFK